MKKDADSPIVRAKDAPRTAASNRRVDPFLVVLGVAVILVGFVVGRGMGATPSVAPTVASTWQSSDAHSSATFGPSATSSPQASGADRQGDHGASGGGSGASGVGGHVVPVDPAYASTVNKVIAKNESTDAQPAASPSNNHQLVELTSSSVSSAVGSAANGLTQSLQAERARLVGAEAQLGSDGDATPAASPTTSPAAPTGGFPSVGGAVPGEIPGGFTSPAPYEIPGGSWVPVQLVAALDSDLSGEIKAQVEGDQCDPRTGAVVIPDGSWLHAKYTGLGAARHLDFSWYRLTQPDLTYRDLSYAKTEDEEGHAGMSGKINTQRWAFFRDTLVGSIANAAGQIIAGAVSRGANVSVGNTISGSSAIPSEVASSLQDGVATPFLVYLQANYTVDHPYHGEFCR